MRYSIRALLLMVAFVALVCFVILAAPSIVRASILFVAVVIMPVPLFVFLRHGGRKVRTFAFGSLVAYAVWLVLGGFPCAAMVAYRFIHGARQDTKRQIEYIVDGYYAGYVGLYAPWIVVPFAGAVALVVHWLVEDRNEI
jgi:hypothetical protein